MNEDQTRRTTDRVATLLLAAILEYSHARAIALAKNLSAAYVGGQRTHTWLDYDRAASEIAHAFASYVAFGHEPTALVKVSGHGCGERAAVWCARVAEDLATRLRGETSVIPSTDDLPAPPVAVVR